MENNLIYIASPFSSDDSLVKEYRFHAVAKYAAFLMNKKRHVMSPIAHGYPIAKMGDLPTDWKYWEESCKVFVSRCQEMHVLMLDGWHTSCGVLGEIDYAKSIGMKITYICPITYKEVNE